MNSPLEIREVHLRGLHRRLHREGARCRRRPEYRLTRFDPQSTSAARDGPSPLYPSRTEKHRRTAASHHGTPPVPDLSAKADIAVSLPRIHSPGSDVRHTAPSLSHTGNPSADPRIPPRYSSAPDPSAKADITFSVPRFQSPGTDARHTAPAPIPHRPRSAWPRIHPTLRAPADRARASGGSRRRPVEHGTVDPSVGARVSARDGSGGASLRKTKWEAPYPHTPTAPALARARPGRARRLRDRRRASGRRSGRSARRPRAGGPSAPARAPAPPPPPRETRSRG